MRIYLLGSHSTGKTTLSRYISSTYNLPMISEMARTVLAEMEMPIERMRADIEAVNKYQIEVIKRQVDKEKAIQEPFVSDRAFDSIAYAAEHSTVTRDIMSAKDLQNYINWVKGGVVFFVRPDKALLKEDGVRENPTWESALRIDGMVKLMLEMYGVDYYNISTPSMQERVRFIDIILKDKLDAT